MSPSDSDLSPLPIDDAIGNMNIRTDRPRSETFARLIVSEAFAFDGKARVLDVGCGTGLGLNDGKGMSSLRAIRSSVAELWGCEPDPNVVPSDLLDRFERGTLETAQLPEAYFDIIYAHYVVEHVTHPSAFLRRASMLLRPGGRFIFMTPNGNHYFVKVARVVAALGLEQRLLDRIHTGAAAAHYPTKYLLNERRTIVELAADAGFAKQDFAYFDHGDIRPYFPRFMRWVALAQEKLLNAFRKPELLPGLVVRLQKSG